MSNRDEFSGITKNILRDRAGNKCSFPTCRAPTSGSSDESSVSVDSTGMACHIFAAAAGKGAKRYDLNMSPQERRSPENGIWMCYKHGKQIDNDECRFTSEVLFQWKKVAEIKSQIENQLGRSIDNEPKYLFHLGLATQNISVPNTTGLENSIIGESLKTSCADVIWGKDIIGYLRDYLIERTRNAFKHGKAKSVILEIHIDKIVLIDDGDDFTHHDLLASPKAKGGASSRKKLLQEYGNVMIAVSQRIQNKNIATFSIPKELDKVQKITPCTIELTYQMRSSKEYSIEVIKSCSDMYIRLPEYFSTSDLYWLHTIMPQLNNDYKRLVFIMSSVAEYIPNELSRSYPGSKIIDLSKY